MKLLLIISLSLCSSVIFSQTLYPSTPNVNIFTGFTGAQIITTSYDQSLIIIGYQGGIIRTFNTNGGALNYTINLNYTANIIWIQSGYSGPTIGGSYKFLDSLGNVYTYSQNGTYILRYNYNAAVYGIATTQNMTNFFQYIAINQGSLIMQNIINITNQFNMDFVKSYPPFSGTSFTAIQYTQDKLYMIGAANNSYVYIYNASNGNLINYNFPTGGSNVKQIHSLSSGNNILLTLNGNVYLFTQPNFNCTLIGKITTNSVFNVCPSELIVSGQSGQSHINVFSLNGNKVQTLTYPTNAIVSIYCSSNYLISVDASGYLAVNSLPTTNSRGIPDWGIGLIAGFSCILGALIIVGIIILIRRKNKNKQITNKNQTVKQMLNGY